MFQCPLPSINFANALLCGCAFFFGTHSCMHAKYTLVSYHQAYHFVAISMAAKDDDDAKRTLHFTNVCLQVQEE